VGGQPPPAVRRAKLDCLSSAAVNLGERKLRNAKTKHKNETQKQMRLRDQPSQSRIVRRPSRLAFPPLRATGRRYRSDSTHIHERHIYRYDCRSAIRENRNSATSAAASGPTQLNEPDCGGGRSARATSTRLRVSDFPPAIHPRESPVCRWLRRNHRSASLERSHVFGEPTVPQIVADRNTKTFRACAETVDDGTSLWKPEENQESIYLEQPNTPTESITYTM
jgi:hypothetical protein